jgi:hypothetical protein
MFKHTLLILALLCSAFCLNAQQNQFVYPFGEMSNTNGAPIEITFEVETGGTSITGSATTDPNGSFITQISWVGSPWTLITATFENCDSTLTSFTMENNPNEEPNLVDVMFELNYCEALNIYGCTDPAASNYDPEANTDDGSCIYEECEGTEYLLTVSSETFGNNLDYQIILNNDSLTAGSTPDNASTFSIPFCLDGCATLILNPGEENTGGTYFNFTSGFESFYSGQIYPGEQVFIFFGSQEGCQVFNGHNGCMDEEAINFNPWAIDDNGNCEYEEDEEVENDLCENASPLQEGVQLINNVGADSNEGIFGDCWAFGNGKGEQSSIWYTFTTPEDPAAITIEALTDETNTFTDTQFGLFEECGGEMIYCDGNSGNGLMSKFDFACGELESNTTYILLVDGYQGDNGTCYLEYSMESPCEVVEECEANPAIVNIVTNTWSDEISWAILQEGELVAEGSDYQENNYQYTEEICLEDGCYTFEMYDSYGDGWNGGSFSIWLEDGTSISSGSLETGEYGSVTFGVNAECEEEIAGCTDSEALNYDPEATTDDGSCLYEEDCPNFVSLELTTEQWGSEISWSITQGDEIIAEGSDYENFSSYSEFVCLEDGCYTLNMYDSFGDGWNGAILTLEYGDQLITGALQSGEFGALDFGINADCEGVVAGCTDPEATNYDPEATLNDGSCEYGIDCEANEILIQVNPGQEGDLEWNFYNDDELIEGDGSNGMGAIEEYLYCVEDGCYTITIEEVSNNQWTGSIFIHVNGQTYLVEPVDSDSEFSFDLSVNSTCEENVEGCTDSNALNYNPDATSDDGSCIYEEDCPNLLDLTMTTELWGYEISWNILQGDEIVAEGSDYENSTENSEFLCLEDGCYTLQMFDSYGDGWNGGSLTISLGDEILTTGTIDDGEYGVVQFGVNSECDEEILGCMDPEALNYNPEAIFDDGSCEYEDEEVENDLCENASPLQEGIQLISNVGADSNEGIFGDCWAFGNGEGEQSSIWYTFTTPEEPSAITIEAITDGSNTFTDTQFGLFEECGGEMIYCDGNSGNGLMSKFEFACGELESNTTYILLVDGYLGDSGTCYLEYIVQSPCEVVEECESNPAIVNIVTNTWSYEISWAIFQEGELVAEGYNYQENNYQYTEEICLEDGCYTFEMYDSYGDGWNGGSFSIWLDDGTFISSGSLETGESGSVTFGVNVDCEEEIEGCTDPEATNYNPEATINDGSCEYQETPCESNEVLVQLNAGPGVSFEWGFNSGDEYLEGGGYGGYDGQGPIEEYTFCVEDGCYNFTVYDFTEADWTGLICIYVNGQVYLIEQINSNSNLSFDIGVNSECGEIEGCIDPEANNYDPDATVDDGSCVYDCHTVDFLLNGNSLSENIIWSLENDSTSYSSNQIDDTFCAAAGCYTFTFENTVQGNWYGNLQIFINGQEEVTANINSFVDIYEFTVGINTPSCGVPVIEGCTDPQAVNFDPGAIEDNGSCFYEGECDGNLLHIGNDFNTINSSGTDFMHFQIFDIEGDLVTEGNSSNAAGDNFVCLEDGCYTLSLSNVPEYWSGGFFLSPVFGSDFELNLIGMDASFFTIDGSVASSYEVNFSINNDDCFVEGCTDPEAINYNDEATLDDGSCIYEEDCSINFDLLADSANLNTIFVIPALAINDAVSVLWDFGDGTTSTELFPDHEYEGDGPYNLCLTVFFEVGQNDTCDVTFCMEITADMIPDLIPGAGGNSAGFFINIIEDASTIGVDEEQYFENIEVYPNPTSNFVTVSSEMNWADGTTITLYNMHGAILNSQPVEFGNSNTNYKIDLSEYSSGLYFINVSSKGEHKTFKILKD